VPWSVQLLDLYYHKLFTLLTAILDCMTKSKFGDHDADYWHHADRHVAWDSECRVNHDQPSWYFSFMGRRGKMVQWTKAKRTGPA